MEAAFRFLAENPYILLFLVVGLAVGMGRLTFNGYGLGMVASAIVVGAAVSTAGLARLALPADTYPQQREPVVTAAATALLVTTADAPATEVERVTDLVFTRMPQRPRGSADAVRVSAAGESRGVTIPLHPGATRQPQ